MLPSDINLKIRSGTVGGYNNKILISDQKFSLGKNDKVNSLVLGPMGPASGEPVIAMPKDHPSHKVVAHEDEKIAFVLFLACGFVIWNIFR